MTADFGPCSDWPIYWTCPDKISTASPALTGYAAGFATRTLWALSGRRYGTCSVTLRPCAQDCYNDWNLYPSWSGQTGYTSPPWDWYTIPYACGSCTGTCSCTRVSEIRLPALVNSVVQVLVDGSPLVTGAYRLDDNRILVRTDGQAWPRCNNLNLADTQTGTWSVTALYGEDVPESARLAMGELGCEIVKAGQGQDCRLPPGVTSLVRQGVTIQFPDIGQLLKDGRTGLYLVDMFLATENPYGIKQRARAYSVDRLQPRRAGS